MPKNTPKVTILIVDDSPDNLSLLDAILNKDYRIKAATNGEKALAIAQSPDPPTLILLDVMMPGMDGREVCYRLKNDPQTRHIPIIFISALDDSDDEALGLSLGAIDYISKPISPAVVKARVKNHIELYLQEERLRLQSEVELLYSSITQRIRSTLVLEEVLNTVVTSVHDFLKSDRVLVYRVLPNGTGKVIAESVNPPWPKLLEVVFPEEIFPKENYERYVDGRTFALNDRVQEKSKVLPCLTTFLEEIQVIAKLVVPIVQDKNLWGLLIAHQCSNPRYWSFWEENLLKQIASQVSIAIQQAVLFEQLQLELNERQQAEKLLKERNELLDAANKQLERATQLKDEFLANMSHELRTPLNSILGMSEGLQDGVFGVINQEQRTAIQTIERSGFHLLELINDILDLAKIEAGKVQLEIAPTSISPVCSASMAFIKQQAMQKQISLEVKIAPNLPDVLIDERRVRQVLINLLSNAVKFTPSNGKITLEVQARWKIPPELNGIKYVTSFRDSSNAPLNNFAEGEKKQFLYISVLDTGIGISVEDMDKLFHPFTQIDSALNRQYSGTGLGLALVKKIVEMHGGQVGLASKPQVGSCFMISLPFVVSGMQVFPKDFPTPTIDTEFSPANHSCLILLAEDNEANITTTTSYLKAKGYRIVLAKNGQEAVEIARSQHPDLVLMDIQMPGMDGLKAMELIRSTPELKSLPIVALTALAMPDDEGRCLRAGATAYVKKPIRFKNLIKIMEELLT